MYNASGNNSLRANLTVYPTRPEVWDTSDTCTASCWMWRTVPVVLFLAGMLGNTLTIIVVIRLGLRRQPTLMFLFFLAITDSVVLITGLPRYWIDYVFDVNIRLSGNVGCKLYYFIIYASMQYSSWILVSVTIERVFKTYFPFRYRRLFTTKRAIVGLLTLLFVLCLVNGHFFFTNGINEYTNGTCDSLTPEFSYFDEYVFVYIDLSILSIVPFIIMVICNILLIKVLRDIQIQRHSMMHARFADRANHFSVRMTKMLVVCTIYFLAGTLPISIYFVVDSYLLPKYEAADDVTALENMDVAWTVTYLFSYSNYCVNFYLYTAMNNRFYQELKTFVLCLPR